MLRPSAGAGLPAPPGEGVEDKVEVEEGGLSGGVSVMLSFSLDYFLIFFFFLIYIFFLFFTLRSFYSSLLSCFSVLYSDLFFSFSFMIFFLFFNRRLFYSSLLNGKEI